MTGRLFIDTAFVQALFNAADQLHQRAVDWAPHLDRVAELWTTEAVLIEIGNALSATNRVGAVEFIEQVYRIPKMRVVSVDTILLNRAATLYRDRSDKQWGLTDCISFVVMSDNQLVDALTSDHHFVQAGFNALLQQSPI